MIKVKIKEKTKEKTKIKKTKIKKTRNTSTRKERSNTPKSTIEVLHTNLLQVQEQMSNFIDPVQKHLDALIKAKMVIWIQVNLAKFVKIFGIKAMPTNFFNKLMFPRMEK